MDKISFNRIPLAGRKQAYINTHDHDILFYILERMCDISHRELTTCEVHCNVTKGSLTLLGQTSIILPLKLALQRSEVQVISCVSKTATIAEIDLDLNSLFLHSF